MLLTVPNVLTWMRIFSIPVVVLLFYMPFPWSDPAAGALFAIAGITDSLDGYFARKYGLPVRPVVLPGRRRPRRATTATARCRSRGGVVWARCVRRRSSPRRV